MSVVEQQRSFPEIDRFVDEQRLHQQLLLGQHAMELGVYIDEEK